MGSYRLPLPPVCTKNDVEIEFLKNLTSELDSEVQKLEIDDVEQRFALHQEAFGKIVENVVAYRPTLTKIKHGYDSHVNALRGDYRQALFLNTKLKAMASEPTTLKNYQRRIEELETRMDIVKDDNERIRNKIAEIRKTKLLKAEEMEKSRNPLLALKKDPRIIPGLTMDELTNVQVLKKKNRRLERVLRDMRKSFSESYVDKGKLETLKKQMVERIIRRDSMRESGDRDNFRLDKLKIASYAASIFNEMKPPNQMLGDTIVCALNLAMKRKNGMPLTAEEEEIAELLLGSLKFTSLSAQSLNQDDDDPTKDKEAEEILEYIDKFNDLFMAKQYEAAAFYAVCSHKGVLRTMATLLKFKQVKATPDMTKSPLLLFVEALLMTVPSYGSPPPADVSLECVMCAIQENRLDLVTHWITSDRLTLTQELGTCLSKYCLCKALCICSFQALAESIFRKLQLHKDATKAMLKQGRVHAFVSYSQAYRLYTTQDYANLLQNNFTTDLFYALINPQHGALDIGTAMNVLMSMGQEAVCVFFLQDIFQSQQDKALGLQDIVSQDFTTGMENWLHVSTLLAKHNFTGASRELYAAIIVKQCLVDAVEIMKQSYKSI